MPRTKPAPIWCGEKVEHEPHPFRQENKEYHCQGFVSPIRQEYTYVGVTEVDDPYEKLNSLWLPLAPFRLKIAALVKEGNNEYPVGEIIRIMKEILDAPA